MAITIDRKFVDDLGLADLPDAEKDKLIEQIFETLETRVGMRLADVMSEEQLDEFEKFVDGNDEAGAMDWLNKNYPNYPKVVEEELAKLKTEISTSADKIKEASKD